MSVVLTIVLSADLFCLNGPRGGRLSDEFIRVGCHSWGNVVSLVWGGIKTMHLPPQSTKSAAAGVVHTTALGPEGFIMTQT